MFKLFKSKNNQEPTDHIRFLNNIIHRQSLKTRSKTNYSKRKLKIKKHVGRQQGNIKVSKYQKLPLHICCGMV